LRAHKLLPSSPSKRKRSGRRKPRNSKVTPSSLKQLTEEKQAADAQVSALNNQVKQLQSSMSDKDARIAELEDELSQIRGQLTAARAEIAQLKEAGPVINPMDFSKGVVFKVQIGAFKNKDLQKYFDNNPNFGGEVADKGEQKLNHWCFP
jgi:septal ring factor EnvC (AmiA/AmiB activator)